MAELTKLLGFMSSWDRQAVLAEYAAKFEDCTDFDALVESLGTPTRVAIGLARDYVPTPPPAAPVPAAEPAAEDTPAEETAPAEASLPTEASVPAAETVSEAAEQPEPVPVSAPAPKKKAPVSGGGVVLSVILGLLIALPITIIALCIGLPFLVGGIGAIAAVVSFALHTVPALGLVSDILLIVGGGLAVTAIGLLIAAFGLWLSLTLAALWLEKAVFPVGKRLCRKKEVPQA